MSKNKKITIYAILIAAAILAIAGIIFFSVVCSVKYYNQICPVKLDILYSSSPTMSGNECKQQNGKIVNTLGGDNCSLFEKNIGEVRGMDCPCICCVNKNQSQISIATDKIEYQINQAISFTISNNSTENILISACPQGEGFVEIEKNIAGKWEPIFVSPLCNALCAGPYTLKPNEKHVYSQQEFLTCMDTSIPSAPANYRVKFGYATKLPYSGNTKWIYSNSFEIKYCPSGTVFQLEGCNGTKPCCCPNNAKCD